MMTFNLGPTMKLHDFPDSRWPGDIKNSRYRNESGSRCRLFLTLVFAAIGAINIGADTGTISFLDPDMIGPVSVAVWLLTLIGAFVVSAGRPK